MCDRLLGAGLLESTWGGCRYSKQRKREIVCKEKWGNSEKVGVLPHHNGRGSSGKRDYNHGSWVLNPARR